MELNDVGIEWGTPPPIGNPYLDEVMELVERNGFRVHHNEIDFVTTMIRDGVLSLAEAVENVLGDRSLRHRYAYAIPRTDVIQWMVGVGPIVEVGAGKGYWARMISDVGGDIIAYDLLPPQENPATDRDTPWYQVLVADCEIAAAHRHRTLFMCWPPYTEDMAFRAARSYLDAGGRRIIYIGEGRGGCTADDSFFELMSARMTDVSPANIDILSWFGIHDHLYDYQVV